MSPSLSVQACPVCRQPVTWSHTETIFNRCHSCKTIITRGEGTTATAANTMPVVYKNASLYIGFEGRFNDITFRVTGRIAINWENGFINYFTVVTAKKELRLLAEGYGHYTWCEPFTIRSTITPTRLKSTEILKSLEIADQELPVIKQKDKAEGFETDGESWFPFVSHQYHKYILENVSGTTYLIITDGETQVYAFALIDIEPYLLFGNKAPSFETVVKQCPNCKKDWSLHCFPYSKSYSCPQCQHGYSFKTTSQLKHVFNGNATDFFPALTPGSTGRLDGTEYRVIGACQKHELHSSANYWREYTLFNAVRGMLTLSEYNGHWMIVEDQPTLHPLENNIQYESLHYLGEPFVEFNAYHFRVSEAIGEFPYDLFDADNIRSTEFISPPEMWIHQHRDKQSLTWAHGRHLEKKVLKAAFPDAALPYSSGVGAVQPTGYVSLEKLALTTMAALFFLFSFHYFANSDRKQTNLFTKELQFPDSSNRMNYISEPFELMRKNNLLEVTLSSMVVNSWTFTNLTLVNEKTGEEYNMEMGVEYYSGVEGGESWSEGSVSNEGTFTKIPAGRYILQIDAQKEGDYTYRFLTINVDYDVSNSRNFWFAALFIIIWPIGRALLNRYYETKRWGESFFPEEMS